MPANTAFFSCLLETRKLEINEIRINKIKNEKGKENLKILCILCYKL